MQSHLAAALMGPTANSSGMSSISANSTPCSSPSPRPISTTPFPTSTANTKPSVSPFASYKATNLSSPPKYTPTSNIKNSVYVSHMQKTNIGSHKLTQGESEDGHESEEIEDEDFEDKIKNASQNSRTVTLQMLLAANILQPGQSTMTIEYLVI